MEMVTISHAIESGIIPPQYAKYFEPVKKCAYCHQDVYISLNRRTMLCCNLKCPNKIAASSAKFLSNLGIVGIGWSTAYSEISQRKDPGILSLLFDPPSRFSWDIKEAIKKPYKYSELIEMMSIYEIGPSTVDKLFHDVQNWTDLEEQLSAIGGWNNFVVTKIGSCGIRSDEIVSRMEAYESDLRGLEALFNLKKINKGVEVERIYIGVTGRLMIETNPPMEVSREQYIVILNKFASTFHREFVLTRAERSMEYMVADYPAPEHRQWRFGNSMNILTTSTALLGTVIASHNKYLQDHPEEAPATEQSPQVGSNAKTEKFI